MAFDKQNKVIKSYKNAKGLFLGLN